MEKNPNIDIVVVGSCIYDMFSYTPRFPKAGEAVRGTKFLASFGGKGANQAVQCAKLGVNAALISKRNFNRNMTKDKPNSAKSNFITKEQLDEYLKLWSAEIISMVDLKINSLEGQIAAIKALMHESFTSLKADMRDALASEFANFKKSSSSSPNPSPAQLPPTPNNSPQTSVASGSVSLSAGTHITAATSDMASPVVPETSENDTYNLLSRALQPVINILLKAMDKGTTTKAKVSQKYCINHNSKSHSTEECRGFGYRYKPRYKGKHNSRRHQNFDYFQPQFSGQYDTWTNECNTLPDTTIPPIDTTPKSTPSVDLAQSQSDSNTVGLMGFHVSYNSPSISLVKNDSGERKADEKIDNSRSSHMANDGNDVKETKDNVSNDFKIDDLVFFDGEKCKIDPGNCGLYKVVEGLNASKQTIVIEDWRYPFNKYTIPFTYVKRSNH